ncbi:hypothetical protein DSM104299_03204 [Baekduia alba]|uniref:hypothetical protein n=1 Tax=Baekduia alba TaxID=2997333 RepID=UPI00234096A6|nr:hypothetical protein [Baekduia alba]WCB94467.1 hypothetical protein DSM104299_03204 [Baekduia alba]
MSLLTDTRVDARLYQPGLPDGDEDGRRSFVEAVRDEGQIAAVQINAFESDGSGATVQLVLDREAGLILLAQLADALTANAV